MEEENKAQTVVDSFILFSASIVCLMIVFSFTILSPTLSTPKVPSAIIPDRIIQIKQSVTYSCYFVYYRTIVISIVIFHNSSDVRLIDIWISVVSRYNRYKKSHCSCSYFMPDRVDSRLQQPAMTLKDIQPPHLYM